jgi:hypothetical protein
MHEVMGMILRAIDAAMARMIEAIRFPTWYDDK